MFHNELHDTEFGTDFALLGNAAAHSGTRRDRAPEADCRLIGRYLVPACYRCVDGIVGSGRLVNSLSFKIMPCHRRTSLSASALPTKSIAFSKARRRKSLAKIRPASLLTQVKKMIPAIDVINLSHPHANRLSAYGSQPKLQPLSNLVGAVQCYK
jgi:hypothetical protein